MTEEEWLAAIISHRMPQSIQDRCSERKLRLWAAACFRRAHPLLAETPLLPLVDWLDSCLENTLELEDWQRDEGNRKGKSFYLMPFGYLPLAAFPGLVPNSEEFNRMEANIEPDWCHELLIEAFRVTTSTDLWAVDRLVRHFSAGGFYVAAVPAKVASAYRFATLPSGHPCRDPELYEGARLIDPSRPRLSAEEAAIANAAQAKEQIVQAQRLRDIVGDPSRPPIAFEATWRTPTATQLADTIYNDRHLTSGLLDNLRLTILADALEEAGCNNADILGHLRGGGDHVRGCWVVDLVLGKE